MYTYPTVRDFPRPWIDVAGHLMGKPLGYSVHDLGLMILVEIASKIACVAFLQRGSQDNSSIRPFSSQKV